MYRVLVATVFLLLMVVGIYIGLEVTEEPKRAINQEVVVSNTDSVKIYDEQADVKEEEELIDVDVKFTDIYPDCGHNIESNRG